MQSRVTASPGAILSPCRVVRRDEGKITAILELLKPLGVREIVRTGKVAIQRGMQMLSVTNGGEAVELNNRKIHKEKAA